MKTKVGWKTAYARGDDPQEAVANLARQIDWMLGSIFDDIVITSVSHDVMARPNQYRGGYLATGLIYYTYMVEDKE